MRARARARTQTRADARAHAARALSCYNDGLPRGVNAAGKPAPPPSCGKAAAEVLGITAGFDAAKQARQTRSLASDGDVTTGAVLVRDLFSPCASY